MPTDMVRSKGNMQLSASSARCGEIITFDDMMMPRAWWWSKWADDVGVVGKRRSENAVTMWSPSARRSLVASSFCSSPTGACCDDRCVSWISRSLRSRQADNKLWATSSAVSRSVSSARKRCSTWFGVLVLVRSFCKSIACTKSIHYSNQTKWHRSKEEPDIHYHQC